MHYEVVKRCHGDGARLYSPRSSLPVLDRGLLRGLQLPPGALHQRPRIVPPLGFEPRLARLLRSRTLPSWSRAACGVGATVRKSYPVTTVRVLAAALPGHERLMRRCARFGRTRASFVIIPARGPVGAAAFLWHALGCVQFAGVDPAYPRPTDRHVSL